MTMKANIKQRDYSDEYTTAGFLMADVDGVTRSWTDVQTDMAALVGHVEAHSIGTVASAYALQATQAENDVRPANAFAQRELGLRFYLRDTVTQNLGSFTIGCADLGIGSVVAGKDELDLTASPTAAFVTWIEANLLSPAGNAVAVERAVIVGRNS